MLTYEYICTKCKNSWTKEQKISDEAVLQCPSCKENSAKRIISGGNGFLLVGSGWSADLYSSRSEKKVVDKD